MAVRMVTVPVMAMRMMIVRMMIVRMAVSVGVPVRMGHGQLSKPGWASGPETPQLSEMLYYNITLVHDSARRVRPYGFPISMTIAAARNGKGIDTTQRNQTNRAGMKGISHKITRWNANRAQAIT